MLEPLGAQASPQPRRSPPALWASGYHEARLLAALIDDPKEVTPEQMDRWAADFDSWDLCDQACMKLFVKTPFVEEKIARWAEDEREFVRRAGFALIAAYAVHGKAVPDATYVRLLGLVEKHAGDGRNFVRKAVNWALRQIGKRSAALHAGLALADGWPPRATDGSLDRARCRQGTERSGSIGSGKGPDRIASGARAQRRPPFGVLQSRDDADKGAGACACAGRSAHLRDQALAFSLSRTT